MRRSLLLIASLLIVAAMPVQQTRFVDRDLNFSVDTPANEWRWKQLGDHASWVVTAPDGERFSVSVSGPGVARIDEAWMGELLRSVHRDASSHGDRIEDFQQLRATSPIFPSFSYSYTRIDKNGKRSFVDGWVAAAGRVYALQYASYARQSLGTFRAFVESFQVVDKFESQRAARGASTNGVTGAPPLLTDVLGRPIAPNSAPPVHH